MSTGKTAPMKMTNPAARSVSPNQTIAKGIHARGGIGRMISMMGSRRRFAIGYHPMRIPVGTPTRRDNPSPMKKMDHTDGKVHGQGPGNDQIIKGDDDVSK
jgi:hypothetical protein